MIFYIHGAKSNKATHISDMARCDPAALFCDYGLSDVLLLLLVCWNILRPLALEWEFWCMQFCWLLPTPRARKGV